MDRPSLYGDRDNDTIRGGAGDDLIRGGRVKASARVWRWQPRLMEWPDRPQLKSGAAQMGNRTPVSSSDTTHNRRAVSGSWEAGLDSTRTGYPRIWRKPSGP